MTGKQHVSRLAIMPDAVEPWLQETAGDRQLGVGNGCEGARERGSGARRDAETGIMQPEGLRSMSIGCG